MVTSRREYFRLFIWDKVFFFNKLIKYFTMQNNSNVDSTKERFIELKYDNILRSKVASVDRFQ